MAKKIIRFILSLILGIFVGFVSYIFIQLIISEMVYRDCPTLTIYCITSSPWGIIQEAFGNFLAGLVWMGLWIYILYKISGKIIKS